MIEFTSKNGYTLRVKEEHVPYLRKWCTILSPKTFDACIYLGVCEYKYRGCATCPLCLNLIRKPYTQHEKMEAIQELFDTCCNRSIRGNTIIGMTKPILFKELEK